MAERQATTSLTNWDFSNFHVQEELTAGEFINAETTLIAAGPPEITSAQSSTGGVVCYPIGVLENVGISQSKQIQRIFEIGSSRSYFIPGRVVGSISVGRVMYSGPSLLKTLYAYHANTGLLSELNIQTGEITPEPGFDDFYLNMHSNLFNQPCGMMIYMRNGLNETVGAIYLEVAHVQGHQLSISSGSVLLMEGVSLQYDRIIPVKVVTE